MESTLKLPKLPTYYPEGTEAAATMRMPNHNTEHIPLLVERVLYILHNQTFQIYYVRFTSSMLGIWPGPCTWKEYAQPLSYIPSQKVATIHFYSLYNCLLLPEKYNLNFNYGYNYACIC